MHSILHISLYSSLTEALIIYKSITIDIQHDISIDQCFNLRPCAKRMQNVNQSWRATLSSFLFYPNWSLIDIPDRSTNWCWVWWHLGNYVFTECGWVAWSDVGSMMEFFSIVHILVTLYVTTTCTYTCQLHTLGPKWCLLNLFLGIAYV